MIDRRKVIKGLNTHKSLGYGCDGCPYENNDRIACVKSLCDDAIALLEEQKPKTGCWIIYYDDKTGHDGYKCSECDSAQPWYYDYFEPYEFCPNCGAKMEAI